jgi:hypothetical protein
VDPVPDPLLFFCSTRESNPGPLHLLRNYFVVNYICSDGNGCFLSKVASYGFEELASILTATNVLSSSTSKCLELSHVSFIPLKTP